MRTLTILAAIGLLASLSLPACAQEDMLARIYGEGVHAFFRGDYDCAGSTMEQVINHGSRDPRAYYFRGLSYLRLGMYLEAEEDFRLGATMEVDGSGTYDIGRALERIQGPERLCLERVRRDTLLTMSQRSLPETSPPGTWQGTPGVIPDFGRHLPPAPDPFQDDEPRIEILPEKQPPATPPAAVKPDTPANDDPFESAPADKGAGQDEADAVPAPPKPGATEESDDDIFGSEPGDNPFE